MSPRPTFLFYLYSVAVRALAPIAYRKVSARLAAAGLSAERQRERMGYASAQRPDQPDHAPLIWFHGASVGETLAALTLIRQLSARAPGAQFLLTSGTATSADMAGQRMPANCRHQFAPLDTPAAIRRFLDHWRPDGVAFVESELWPVTLAAIRSRAIPLALVNARLSPKSLASWKKRSKTARFLLSRFDLILPQNTDVDAGLRALGAQNAQLFPGGNLKAGAAPLPVDHAMLDSLRASCAGRPVWIASSTHKGEEETVLAAHKALLTRHQDLCLILVPRHPERGDEIARLIDTAGLTHTRRSQGGQVTPAAQVYLADTLGELGLFYAVSPVVFLGGALLEIGGHNPFEVAQSGGAVITGPGTYNFSETFPPLIAAGGAVEVHNQEELTDAVAHWLDDPAACDRARDAAAQFCQSQADGLTAVVDRLVATLLSPDNSPPRETF